MRSIARFFAVAISQAPGLSGTPVAGHLSSAATSASWARSSAKPTSPTIRARPAIRRACSTRQTASTERWAPIAGTCLEAPELPLRGRLRVLGEVLHLEDAAHLDHAVAPGHPA